ncbi:MAG TPA: hypothetical protein VGD46_16190, partial [Rhizobacter sp.]
TRARLRWAGAGLVLLMLGGLVWQAVVASRAPQSQVDGVEFEPEALAHPDKVEMLARMNEAQLAQQGVSAMTAALRAPSPQALAADETEVCGLGRVKADGTGRPHDMAPIRDATQRLREQIVPTLVASPDDTTRAAGLLIVALGDQVAADGPEGRATRARDELASLAAFTGSPQVYAWALHACQKQRGDGVCRMLSAEQWARLEPSNAMAWLQVAADARVRRDEAAVAEAMYRVSQAPRSDARQGTLVGTVLAKMPPEADLLARIGLAQELARLEARAELPLVAASQHCGASEVRDANRQQVCAAVADVLSRRGSTRAEAALAASIGERAGWAAERVAAAGEERDALAEMSGAALAPNAWSCTALAQALAHFHESARHGELATLRNALKRSPDGAGVLARRYREAQATRVASAASAASTVSP